MKIIQKKLSNESGFTLIETSIVLLVIAILTLLIIPNVTGVKNFADNTTNDAIVQSVEAQILLFETNNPTMKYDDDDEKNNFIGGYVTAEQLDIYNEAKK